MVTKGERWGGGINWEFGINIYTLLYRKLINSKDLLYITRNSAQSVITRMRKNLKMNRHTYMYDRFILCMPETNNIVSQL